MPEAALPSPPGLASTPATERAERARRNGACSRGPVTAAGKATASRNALRHGLCARVHLVLASEDDDAFTALAADVLAEVAPVGAVDGFLATRLAAAMWQTGRADRLEAQAFAAGELPDPDRLRLALRYRGSIGRDLFRTLRELRPQLQAAATARAEVVSSSAPSPTAPLPPTPMASDDDLDPPTLVRHAWAGPHAEPGSARRQPQEDAAAALDFGAPIDQAPDDPTIVLRHGLSLADLLAPDDDACTSEPDLAPPPAAHPAAATGHESTRIDTACTDEPERLTIAEPPITRPCTVDRPVTVVLGAWCRDAACTAEPEPSRAGLVDPADTGHPGALRAGATRPNEPGAPAASTREPDPWPPRSIDPVHIDGPRHPNDARWRNEPSAPAGDTLEPDGVTGSTVAVGSVQDTADPPVDAWSRMWGLTPPTAPSRPARRARHEPYPGHTVAAHPSESACHRSGLDAGEPAASPVLAGSSQTDPAPRAPEHSQPAVAPPDFRRPPHAAEPAGIAPSPPAADDLPRWEAHRPGAHPGPAGRRRRAVSRRHRATPACEPHDHQRSNVDHGAPQHLQPESGPLGCVREPDCSASSPTGSAP